MRVRKLSEKEIRIIAPHFYDANYGSLSEKRTGHKLGVMFAALAVVGLLLAVWH